MYARLGIDMQSLEMNVIASLFCPLIGMAPPGSRLPMSFIASVPFVYSSQSFLERS
jgi:hypothetical protein